MTDPATPHPRDDSPSTETAGSAKARMPLWLVRTIVGAVAAVVLVIAYLIASVTVPLMWANTIKDQMGGQLGNSIPLGMFYGFTFTFVPILIAWQARRRKLNKWVRLSLVVVGLLLSIPNLLTLLVLFANTQTAANARTIWATEANWFGAWSQVFMVVGVACAIAVIVLGRMWLRRGKKIREVKAAEKLVRKDQQARERVAREDARLAAKAAAKAKHGKSGTSEAARADAAESPEPPQS